MAAGKEQKVRPEVGLEGCDTEALVRTSEQFAELELEMMRRGEITASQIAADKADWNKVGTALGQIYRLLGENRVADALKPLHEVEVVLSRKGILVAQPGARKAPREPEPVPYQEELQYGE